MFVLFCLLIVLAFIGVTAAARNFWLPVIFFMYIVIGTVLFALFT